MMAYEYYLVHLNSRRKVYKDCDSFLAVFMLTSLWRGYASSLTSLYSIDSDPMCSCLLEMNLIPVGKSCCNLYPDLKIASGLATSAM